MINEKKKKTWFGKLMDRLDKGLEEKSRETGCCCEGTCSKKKSKK